MQMAKKSKLVWVRGPLKIAIAASEAKQMSVSSGGML